MEVPPKKLRCQHCGQWRKLGECVTLDDRVDNYGDYCICEECATKYSLNYWREWERNKKGVLQKGEKK